MLRPFLRLCCVQRGVSLPFGKTGPADDNGQKGKYTRQTLKELCDALEVRTY